MHLSQYHLFVRPDKVAIFLNDKTILLNMNHTKVQTIELCSSIYVQNLPQAQKGNVLDSKACPLFHEYC